MLMPAMLAAQSVFLASVFKPLVFVAFVLAWGRWATIVDKDAAYFYLKRRRLNALTFGAGAVGMVLWLLVFWFWLGLAVFLLFSVGGGVAYTMMRNPKVPASERWRLNSRGLQRMLLRREQADAEQSVNVKFVASSSATSSHYKPVPRQDDAQYNAHVTLDEMITAALARNAQRLDLALTGNELAIRMHIDGVTYRHEGVGPSAGLAAIDYLKSQCGLDVDDRRRKQAGRTSIDAGEYGHHDLDVETAGTTRGLTLAIEFNRRRQLSIPFEELGLLDAQYDQLKPLLVDNEGLVIVAGPSHEGRTTTLYALLQQHDPYLTDVHTLEQPIEADVEGVSQHTPAQSGWTKSLNSLLLRDPAVVMLGQLPETETAKLAAKAATDHKRLYVGVRAEDTFSALRAWAKAVGDLQIVAEGTRAVIAQRLVRKLCPTCSQAYQPDAAALKKLNLPADRMTQLHKAGGQIPAGRNQTQPCPTCHGIGFTGRTAAFEVMIIDDEARQYLRQGDITGLRGHLRRKKMLWLQEAALAKVVSGKTSISEVMRVLGQGQGQQQGRAQVAGGSGGPAKDASS